MKFLRFLLGWTFVLGSIAAVLWGSFLLRDHLAPAALEEEAKAEGEHEKEEHEGLHLDEEAQKRLRLTVVELKAAQWLPQITAYGEVLNLLPLQDLLSDITGAEATAATAKRALERNKTLTASGDLAEKDYDAAEMLSRDSDLKLAALRRHRAMEWGEAIQKPLAPDSALLRVELPATQPLAEFNKAARVTVAGSDLDASTTVVTTAPTQDAKTQLPALIIRIETGGKLPPAGAPVTAALTVAGEPAKGVLVPAEAVLHFNGLAWVYVEEKPGQYERHAITLDRPLADGWFAEEGLEEGDRVVTTGAVNLLAIENKSLLGAKE